MTPDPGAETLTSPLVSRYASREMVRNFSDLRRMILWRDLWIALAEAEREVGLPITEQQLRALREAREKVDFGDIAREEARRRHDVMAAIHAYGKVAPEAAGILHLGATSCTITDNADLILIREGLAILGGKLVRTLRALGSLAGRTRALPVLGYTHLQPAQPTTFGKRACLWAQDLLEDLEEVERLRARLPFLGARGTTGTQASFLDLLGGDHARVRRLDDLFREKMGFSRAVAVAGQTYPRTWDARVLFALAGIAASAARFSNDLRFLQSTHEAEEPFGKEQVGSSAMPYKRNPVLAERMGSLARYLQSLAWNGVLTASGQFLERTLDDSAARRLAIPDAFLAADGILEVAHRLASGIVLNEKVIARRLADELPFLATEALLMEAVRAGGDRQALHEILRRHARAAAAKVHEEGGPNDLLDRLAGEAAFAPHVGGLRGALSPERFVGRAPEQVDEFLGEVLRPALDARADVPEAEAEVRV